MTVYQYLQYTGIPMETRGGEKKPGDTVLDGILVVLPLYRYWKPKEERDTFINFIFMPVILHVLTVYQYLQYFGIPLGTLEGGQRSLEKRFLTVYW